MEVETINDQNCGKDDGCSDCTGSESWIANHAIGLPVKLIWGETVESERSRCDGVER
jgi:hypothetical protein